MNIHAFLVFLAIGNSSLGFVVERPQDANRTWGQPARGLRSSISVEKAHISSQGPFVVSIIVENVSENPINVEKISSFQIGPQNKDSDFPLGYWCPVDFEAEKPSLNSLLILASRSRLVLDKGASLRTTLDLSRHGWQKNISSQWPDRKFEDVVPKGKYLLRLDIEILDGDTHNRVRSNEVEIIIEAP
jgi:hypothetical protein